MKLICGCNKVIHKASLIDLKDNKDFIKRKILVAKCPHCHNLVLTISETRAEDNKTFINESLIGKRAFNYLWKEKANIISQSAIVDISHMKWIYGQNVQIRNRKGEITQLRQYSCDFTTGKRKLEKVIKFS